VDLKSELTIPNALSVLRLLLVPVFLVLLLDQQNLAALLVLIFASATDWFDGFLARKLNQVTKLGARLDPAADRLYIFATLIGLAVNGNIPVWLAVVVILRDVMLATTYPVLATHGYGPLPVHFLGKAGTFALLYAFPLLLLADIFESTEHIILPIAWAFAFWGIGLYWWAGFVYVRQVIDLVTSSKPESANLLPKGDSR
jgi:cardiolipin synthase